MRYSANTRSAFTLVELLISVSIVSLLSTMMFVNYSRERTRGNLKAAVQQLQTDLQTQQTNAQGGVNVNGRQPRAYGIELTSTNQGKHGYTMYSSEDNYTFESTWHTDNSQIGIGQDYAMTSRMWASTSGLEVYRLLNGDTNFSYERVGLAFTAVTSKAILSAFTLATDTTPVDPPPTSLRLMLRNTALSTCYSILVTGNVGTVSTRQLISCS